MKKYLDVRSIIFYTVVAALIIMLVWPEEAFKAIVYLRDAIKAISSGTDEEEAIDAEREPDA